MCLPPTVPRRRTWPRTASRTFTRAPRRVSPAKVPKAYHLRGARLPYDQLQYFEGHLSAREVLARARTLGVSLTSYLGASLMLAIYGEMATMDRRKPISISLPVNLAQLLSQRDGPQLLQFGLCDPHPDRLLTRWPRWPRCLTPKLKEILHPENIKAQMDEYEKLEHMPGIRPVPLFIKNLAVRFLHPSGGNPRHGGALQHGQGGGGRGTAALQ